MRVFVVGATGVLGRAVIPRLVARGDSVVALVRSSSRAAALRLQGVEIVEGDLLRVHPARLRELLVGCDAAAHLATAFGPDAAGPDGSNTTAALRIDGTRRLLDAVLAAGVRRYLQQSIVTAYPDSGDTWLDESTPFDDSPERAGIVRPVVEMEAMVRAIPCARLEWVIARGGLFVGPGTSQDAAIGRLRDSTQTVQGDGSNWMSFVHVDDMAEAVVTAIHSAPAGIVLHVSDEPIRNSEYLDRLAAAVGAPPPGRDPEAPLPRSFRCTNRVAREMLGWSPIHSLWPTSQP